MPLHRSPGSAPIEYPDAYPLAALRAEPNQSHPDVVRLTATMEAMAAARVLLAAAAPDDAPPADPNALLPLLARACRLDASAASCQSRDDIDTIISAVFRVLPTAPVYLQQVMRLDELPTAFDLVEDCDACYKHLALDALSVLVHQLFFLHDRGLYPAEVLVTMLDRATLSEGLKSEHATFLGLFASVIPSWTRPAFFGDKFMAPGRNKMWLQTETLEKLAALLPCGPRRGEIQWRLGASFHIQLDSPSAPPDALARARAALLAAARQLPPGSSELSNTYLRLACLVVAAAGGDATARGHVGCELTGAEAALFVHWLKMARGARARVLAAHARRWPGGDRPINIQIAERVHEHESAYRSARVVACSQCGRRGAALRCARCATVYCSEGCQRAAWGAAAAPHKGVCALLARAAAQLREMGEFGGREELGADEAAFVEAHRGRLVERRPLRKVD